MIRNVTKNRVLSERPFFARSCADRARGMIGRAFEKLDGMVFDGCNAIHTFFMSQSIDVLFLDADGNVLKAVRSLRPWRLFCGCARASRVIELPEGVLERTGTEKGDALDCSKEGKTIHNQLIGE